MSNRAGSTGKSPYILSTGWLSDKRGSEVKSPKGDTGFDKIILSMKVRKIKASYTLDASSFSISQKKNK